MSGFIDITGKMLIARKEAGLANKVNWQTGLDVFKWWLGDNIDQLTLFDDEELYNAFADAE